MANFAVEDIFKTIDELAPQYEINPTTAKSIIAAENTKDGRIQRGAQFSGSATNENQTMGIGQVIPSTARGLQQAGLLPADWKFDPKNLRSQLSASLAAMKDMRSRMRNPDDPYELGAYYNGGTNGWENYKAGRALVPETAQYLQKQRTFMADNLTPQQIERLSANPSDPGIAQRRSSGSSTSSRTTTSSSVFDDGAMANFQAAAGLLSNPGGLYDQAFNAVSSRGTQAAGIDLMGSILQAGNDAAEAARAKATLEAAGQARRAAILTKANLNPEVAGNRYEQALNDLDTTSARLDALRPEIDARTSVGFFDNPLEWIVNQTRLPGMINEYNNLVQVQQDQLGRFDAAKDLASSTINMSQAIDADATLAAGNALAKATASKAVQDARTVQLQLASKSAADALQAVAIGQQAADLSLKQLMLTQQRQAQSEGMTEREAAKEAERAVMADLGKLVEAAGGSPEIFNTMYKSMTPAARQELMSSVSRGKFGKDFVSSLQFVQTYGNLDNMAVGGQAAVRTWINDTQRAASAETLKAQADAENPGSPKYNKKFDIQKEMKEQLEATGSRYVFAANNNMRGQSDSNPYKIAYQEMVKLPQFQNNIWAQQIAKYGPGGTEQMFDSVDEQNFMKKAILLINQSADPQTAVKKVSNDIASFYQQASKTQQNSTKPQMFGLATPSRTYPVQLPNFQTGDKPQTVDLGDASQVENLLTRQVARMNALNTLSIFAVGEKLSTRQKLGMSPFGE